MTAKAWSEIRARKFSLDELRRIDQEVESELLKMDLRALREAEALGGTLEIAAIVNGKRIKLAES